VVNEPIVPVPPPADEVHEVLPVDDQLTLAVAPFAIEDGTARSVTLGLDISGELFVGVPIEFVVESTVVDPLPPPHEARPETAKRTAKNNLGITLEPTAMLCNMIVSLQ